MSDAAVMSNALVTVEYDGDVAIITMNDPATLNAVSLKLQDALTEAFAEAETKARAIVLTGAGRGFSSGANLASSDGVNIEDAAFDLGKSLEERHNPFLLKLRDLKVPFITAVNGPAAGIGCSFALSGDLIVASESAYFLQAFRRIGLVPDGGSPTMLTKAVGRVRAMEMMLLGEKLPAAKALEWGLVNRVVPDGQVVAEAKALAAELAAGPTKALAQIRKLGWAALETPFADMLQRERETQRDMGRTADFREGVVAFLTKRPAKFTGE